MKKWRILARHRWVSGATITESISADGERRRFTATIDGWQNWKLWQGRFVNSMAQEIIKKVKEIQARIQANDESVFDEKQAW